MYYLLVFHYLQEKNLRSSRIVMIKDGALVVRMDALAFIQTTT